MHFSPKKYHTQLNFFPFLNFFPEIFSFFVKFQGRIIDFQKISGEDKFKSLHFIHLCLWYGVSVFPCTPHPLGCLKKTPFFGKSNTAVDFHNSMVIAKHSIGHHLVFPLEPHFLPQGPKQLKILLSQIWVDGCLIICTISNQMIAKGKLPFCPFSPPAVLSLEYK